MRERISHQWIIVGVALFGFLSLIYSQYLGSAFVLWDDDFLIVKNPLIRSLSFHSIRTAFTSYDPELYIPLTFLSYQVNYLIGGLHPFIYHLTNFLLHGANALLVAGIAHVLSRKNLWIAVVAGALFAVHPLHAEAVMWASARKDVLAAMFFLASVLLYLRYRESRRSITFILSLIAFTLALLSKVVVITLPVILVLLDWWDGRFGGRSSATPLQGNIRGMFTEKIPYVVLSVIFGIVAVFGKTAQAAHSTVTETILMTIKGIVVSLQHFVVPLHLSPLYPYIGTISLSSPDLFIPVILLLSLFLLALWSLKYTRDGMFALLFFVITYLPSATNFRKGEEGDIYITSDRYAYLPSVAAVFLVALILWHFREALTARAVTAVTVIITLVLACVSFAQAAIWQNSEALFTAVVRSYPDAQAAHHNLGVLYQEQGRMQEAYDEYQLALAIAPKASTESNIGDLLREQGHPDEALQAYRQALTLNPRSVDATLGIGLLALQSGDVDAAIAAFTTAIEIDPANPEAHLDLGVALLRAKRTDDAIIEYQKAIALDDTSAAAHFNLAVVLERVGKTQEAVASYTRALELDASFVPAAEALTRLGAR